MMYPYMTLADGTEIVHSHVILKEGVESVEINFERPALLQSNAHLLFKYAQNGGIHIA